MWDIWLKINDNLFNKKESILMNNIIAQASEFHLMIANNSEPRKAKVPIHLKWEPPPIGKYKLKMDGPVKKSRCQVDWKDCIRITVDLFQITFQKWKFFLLYNNIHRKI